ncbi:hypothetical protein BP6252_05366 [Coleophoma cylindrospora]|uniref:Rad60/SUMO-like domain-containing protein n=1 Tax=Coleophoma cylindrospora TaxID=1849047 RepID=A0A3D8RTE0_9HELO|nr:hypothetical protein BP6252_05366 [Coleophoma cylindrospora]
MADEAAKESASVPQPVKRSLFKKSKWAPKTPIGDTENEDESVAFFSRAKHFFPSVVAEKERKQKEKAVKTAQRKRSSASREASVVHEEKRRRTSDGADNESASSQEVETLDSAQRLRSASTQTTPGSRRSLSSSQQHMQSSPPEPLSEQYEQALQKGQHRNRIDAQEGKGVIVLDDSDDESNYKAPKPIETGDEDVVSSKGKAATKSLVDDDDPFQDSDPEFAEIMARARERQRKKLQDRLANGTSLSPAPEVITENTIDPVVQIFISSYIDGSRPLQVRRRWSQPLKLVRQAWLDKQILNGQPLDESARASIFLTWRNKRLFDVSSCKTMGLKIDKDGQLYHDGDGFDADGRVHIEAWTDELFGQHLKRLETSRLLLTEDSETKAQASPSPSPEPEVQVTPKIRIIIKARNYPDFKTKVSQGTPILKLIVAFKQKHGIEQEKDVTLRFDGDALDENANCGDVELEDMDTLEAHVL